MSKQVDCIIVGQGLAGSVLAMECLRRGKTVCVFDDPERNRASVIAAGICNPVTGRVMTKTYLADQLFPFLRSWYAEAEGMLNERFFSSIPVYRPFLSQTEQQQWLAKAAEESLRPFVEKIWTEPYEADRLTNPFGGLEVRQSGVLQVSRWVTSVRRLLVNKGMYRSAYFDEQEVQWGTGVGYGDVQASQLIYCNGLEALRTKWFHWLPLKPLKGETLTIRMDFPTEKIISRGIYVVPSPRNGEFVVGSTYQHEPFTHGPSDDGEKYLLERLHDRIRTPFERIHQDWGIRPTVTDRRPLLGSHPSAPNVIIFNGLGTKGVSLAPYFASALIDWLDKGAALPEEVNISRFKALYSN